MLSLYYIQFARRMLNRVPSINNIDMNSTPSTTPSSIDEPTFGEWTLPLSTSAALLDTTPAAGAITDAASSPVYEPVSCHHLLRRSTVDIHTEEEEEEECMVGLRHIDSEEYINNTSSSDYDNYPKLSSHLSFASTVNADRLTLRQQFLIGS